MGCQLELRKYDGVYGGRWPVQGGLVPETEPNYRKDNSPAERKKGSCIDGTDLVIISVDGVIFIIVPHDESYWENKLYLRNGSCNHYNRCNE